MPDDHDEPQLSWHEKEVLAALRRLANARSQLDLLEEQSAGAPSLDPGDVARADELHTEAQQLRGKAHSRFGGGAAKERLVQVEADQRMVFERLGVSSYDELQSARRAPASAKVDPTMLEFAQREVESAEREWREVQALEIPDDGVDIDLTVDPPAAS
jgi:hypothetical protein